MIAFDRAAPVCFVPPGWRRLAYTLVASLLLHGILLLPGVVLQSPASGQGRLQAVLQLPRAVDAPLPPRLVQAPSSPVARPVGAANKVNPVPRPEAMVPAAARPTAMEQPLADVDAVDGDGLRAYRMALAVAARRQRSAVSVSGLVGRVDLRVAVDAAGPQVSVAISSGQAGLDAAALQLMRLAVADAALPMTLRGRVFAVDVPVVFGAVRDPG